ncbi:MAG: 2OG-Fe(II) oxygenase [Leptolyngbyaceae bacterium]|nr:2OG-Fe(II) oxygenase [Leptolyngbyaceae bacterium]
MVTRSTTSHSPLPNLRSTEAPPTPEADAETDGAESVILVTLLLDGGHEYQIVLDSDAPSLRKLFAILLEPQEKRCKRLFQFPLATDESSDNDQTPALCFTGDRLVGLITDPPIYIQQSDTSMTDKAPAPSVAPPARPPIVASANHYTVMASPERKQSLPKGVIPSRYIQLTHFLDEATHDQLLDFTLDQQSAFVGSSTSTGDINYRQSSVLHHFPDFANLMRGEIHAAFADVIAALKLTPFNITQVEAQLTAHNDENYYKIHNDNGSEDTATRVLTYVYYFYQEPKAFTGGVLRIYDSRIQNNYYVQAESFQDITPINNSIVFFPSHYMHEVLAIQCPSRQFAHSRFTINGWVRR